MKVTSVHPRPFSSFGYFPLASAWLPLMSASLLNHRYRIIKALAEGGFGKTFLVEDTQMPSRRHCVIKQLKPMHARPDVFRIVQARFSREAAVLEAVSKGNNQVPDLYAYFEEGGQFFLVQEWIEGSPLIELVQEDWPEDRVRSLLINCLKALAPIHQQNIIHRDIKPGNIILRRSDNLPCLIDFGAVKELMSTVVRQSGQAKSSLVIGTPGFMSPEQAAGRPTFSSDLYSLSLTMVFLFTGRSPAELPTDSQTGEVLWTQFAPNASDRIKAVLSRAIHPYTQNRYATAADMLAALSTNTLEHVQRQAQTAVSQPSGSSSLQPGPTAVPGASTPTAVSTDTALSKDGAPPTSVQSSSSSSALSSSASSSSSLPWKRVGLAASGLLLAAGVLVGVTPRISFNENASLAEVEDYQATVNELEKAIAEDPNDADAQTQLARAYLEVGEYAQAITQADSVLAQVSDDASALLVKGKVQFATGAYQEAIATFIQAADQSENPAEALTERGNAYYETGQYDSAVDDYRSALRTDPSYARAYKEWSSVNVVQGNAQEALQNLDLAIENGETTISAYVNRGSRKEDLGDRTGAAADWVSASKLTASTAAEFSSRGYAKSRLGNKKGALDDYNQALIVNPNSVQAIINQAYLKYESGEKEQALGLLEKALEINPNSVTALIVTGEIKSNSNPADQEGAIAHYSTALAVNPNDPDVLNNRCSAYFATQQLDLALTDCDRGLQTNPSSESLYLGRGNIRLTLENYEGAIQDYSRSLEIMEATGGNPFREASVYSNRASALVGVQDLNGALSDLNTALELNPDDASDLYKRGLLKSSLNDDKGALEDLRKSADVYLQAGDTANHQNVLAAIEQSGL